MLRHVPVRVGLAAFALLAVAVAQADTPPAHAPPAQVHAQPGDPLHHDDHRKGELIAPPDQGLPAMIAALIVFALVFGALARFGWPVLTRRIDERYQRIREEIESAERARQQAREALAEYERSLAEARAEARRMLEQAKAQQQALAAELKAQADRELAAMKDRARRDIDQARRAALASLYEDAAGLATAIAARILQREVSPQDYQRLVDESLEALRTADGSATRNAATLGTRG